jgi:serine/threonine protein kinase/TolB-like protein/Tfp pilus assembly protein PilF
VECPNCHAQNKDDSRYCSRCAAPLGPGAGGGPEAASLTKTLETPVRVLRPGTLVAGKYRIVEEVGQGGMGIVYKAEDFELKRFVALKFLPPHLANAPELKDRFLIEARAAAALSHPNICVIHEVGQSSEHPYIAMEYVEGETLRDKIRKGPLKSEEALAIVGQVASGLAEAHQKGIIHRDIKSANIMVTAKGQAKVMDFGLAKLSGGSSLTKSQTTLGTVAYMSPEQARGAEMDRRTDIWSLGIVLYEMIVAKTPFRGDHDQAVIYSILHEEPESLKKARPDTAPGLDEIVGQALAKKPADRYQTMEEFREDMEAVREGLKPLKARPVPKKIFGIRTIYAYSALCGVLALIFGFNVGGLRGRLFGKAGGPVRAVRLAVLPFTNLSNDPEQEYFSDGLTQQMNVRLGSLNPQGLSVIGNTSVNRYKKTDTPIDEIGRELGVDYVLEGGAQREGNRVRITAQLIKVRDQTQLWAESFDREVSSILTIQSEVAEKVAGALAVKLLPAELARLARTRTISPEAYEAYLKGSQHWIKMTPGDLDTAQRYFELALQKDPNYAAAYTGIAWVWMVRNQMLSSPLSEAVPKAKEAALKAVELDENLAESHYALAAVYTWHDWNLSEAGLEWKRAFDLNPNYPDGLAMYSHFLMIRGRPDEAMAMIKRALDLDPFNVTIQVFFAADLLLARRVEEAIVECNKALAMQPGNPVALATLLFAYEAKGMDKETLATMRDYLRFYEVPDIDAEMDRGLAEGGYRGAMKRAADMLAARAQDYMAQPTDVAWLSVFAGDNSRALEWLERAYELRDPNLPYLRFPAYDPLRTEPRFQELLRRMNLEGNGTK